MQNQFTCHNCGSPNSFGDKLCRKCGAQFLYCCPQCRSPISNNDATCSNCGNRLSWPARVSAPTNQGQRQAVNIRENSRGAWVAPFITLILILIVAGLAIYFINATSSQPPVAQPSDNFTITNIEYLATPDKTAPVISDIEVNNLSSTSVEIRWTTDELSTSQIIWNTQDFTSSTTTRKEALVRKHSIVLNNLTSGATYYEVCSIDQAGNESVSRQMSFNIEKQPVNIQIDIFTHSLYIENLPPAGTKTTIRGQVINRSDAPVNIKDVEIVVNFTVTGKGSSEITAALDPYPAMISPGMTHKFYVVVPNGTNNDYVIKTRIIGQ